MTILIVLAAFSGSTFGAELADVLKAWKHRSENVKSFRVICSGDYTYGSSNSPLLRLNPDRVELAQDKKASPAEWELWLSGHDNARFVVRRNALRRSGESGKLWRVDSNTSYDGSRFAQVERWQGTDLNLAKIYSNDLLGRPTVVRNIEFKPAVMCVRALDHRFGGFRVTDLKMSRRTGTVGGRQVLIIEGRYESEIWVDPDRDFVVLKYITSRLEMNIDYSRHSTGIWVPSSWTISASSDSSVKAAIWDIKPKLTDAQFAIEFPPNTLVRDLREGVREMKSSYVDESGSQRPLTRSEADQLFAKSMVEVFPSLVHRIELK